MLGLFNKKYDLEYLKLCETNNKPERSNYSIAIIDDEIELPIIKILERHFAISHLHDIDSINQIQGFHIVVCDIKDVGKTFDSKYGGALLVKEILSKYPQKYVIISSGCVFAVDYNEYFKMADSYIKKGADSSEWIAVLDKAISTLNEPFFLWERTRKFLIHKNVNTSIVNKIEQSYIKSIAKKDSKYLTSSIYSNKSYLSNEYVSLALNTLIGLTTSIISNIIIR